MWEFGSGFKCGGDQMLQLIFEMTQNDEKASHQEPARCIKCKDMYGSSAFEDMCSLCFKKEKNSLTYVSPPPPQSSPPSPALSPLPSLSLPTPAPKRDRPVDETIQLVRGRCGKCSKKTTLLGFSCSHCSNEYCRAHRLPELHDCKADFITIGRKMIKTSNPQVTQKKIEDI